jgi:hypothetical protein
MACRNHVAANFSAAQLASGYEHIYRRVLTAEPLPRNTFLAEATVRRSHRGLAGMSA